MTQEEKREIVTAEIGRIHPQLQINERKTTGAGHYKWGGDLLSMCIDMFLEKDTDYIWKVYQDKKLENFLTYMMGFQLKSSSSRFWHKYRKESERSRELLPNYELRQQRVQFNHAFHDEESLIYTCMKKAIEDLNPYEKMVVNEIILDGNNYKNTSEKYNINYYSLKKDTERLKKIIKEKCRHLR